MKTRIYNFSNRGLFSELVGFLNVAFYAFAHGEQVSINDDNSPLYFPNGFDEFFEPVKIPDQHLGSVTTCELTSTGSPRRWASEFRQARLFAVQNCSLYQRRLLSKMLVLNRRTNQEVAKAIAHLSPPPRFNCIHVRRGDKVVAIKNRSPEGNRFELHEYLEAIRSYSQFNKLPIFLMSDDYSVISEAADVSDELGLIFFHNENPDLGGGHDTVKMIKLGQSFRREEVIRLLASWKIACQSHCFAGTYSSNVSRYIAATHQNPDACFSLDIQWDAR